ncbi:hypothetical protein [Acanthamoeba castellanii mimivirus]|jgi:hypothetical protein|uniref:Uncharacterized protein n=2 Tax=Mimivirus TaxID=315393 RepID=E3VZR1_MIMIV|nr:hypothetical protein MIMI_gp0735 [Acanthamoeba polyphaga mimivirus]ADO18337.1 hypothetical protein [Acanthamoeba polyphaga mimivirus]UTE96576.1 hypothetical protein MIMI-L681b [Acanthamoeba polyphaga mimivirus]BAV61809.1 hypothetical protein [Acanthamoeba castellanii mimivirus]BAV62795.1 hypothetical protein [Acanthamoeba castellanii mimivirus]
MYKTSYIFTNIEEELSNDRYSETNWNISELLLTSTIIIMTIPKIYSYFIR